MVHMKKFIDLIDHLPRFDNTKIGGINITCISKMEPYVLCNIWRYRTAYGRILSFKG